MVIDQETVVVKEEGYLSEVRLVDIRDAPNIFVFLHC